MCCSEDAGCKAGAAGAGTVTEGGTVEVDGCWTTWMSCTESSSPLDDELEEELPNKVLKLGLGVGIKGRGSVVLDATVVSDSDSGI
jgi:hypothetical protein